MKILKFLFQGIGALSFIALFMLGLAVTFYSFVEGAHVITDILTFTATEDKVIYKAMGVLDLILLSLSIFIAALGIYELFVHPIDNLPDWIRTKDIDTLKAMLIKIVIIVMGISFLGSVVAWDGEKDLLNFGISIAAVTVALSYFLSVKEKKEEK
ncbi:MAG: YqhA family protein [Bacteroidota bacterium]